MKWINNGDLKNQVAKFIGESIKPMATKIKQNKTSYNRPTYTNKYSNNQKKNFVSETKLFVSDNVPVVAAGVSLLIVTVLGVYCFVNIDKSLLGIEIAEKPSAIETKQVKEITLKMTRSSQYHVLKLKLMVKKLHMLKPLKKGNSY